MEEWREWFGRRKRWREAVSGQKREKNRGEVDGKVGGQRKEGGGGGGEAGHRVVSEACTCWHVKIYIHRHAAHLGPGKGWEGRVRRHRERPGGQRKVREDRGRSVGDTKKSGEDLGAKDETLIGESCDCLMISVHFRPLWWA